MSLDHVLEESETRGLRFGDMLRTLRNEADISISACAALADISYSYLGDVERGSRMPLTPRQICMICRALGARPEPLIRASIRERGSVTLDIADLQWDSPEIYAAARISAVWPLRDSSEVEVLILAMSDR